jgi:hypothetical protein
LYLEFNSDQSDTIYNRGHPRTIPVKFNSVVSDRGED